MVRMEIVGTEAVFTVLRDHVLWSIKRRIVAPLDQIKRVSVKNPRTLTCPPWRTPGTYLPWLITAGTYRGRGRVEFWDVTRRAEALVVDLAGHTYDRLVIETPDPAGSAQTLCRAALTVPAEEYEATA